MKKNDPKVIFLDIDGTLFKHHGEANRQSFYPPQLLDGVKDKLSEWEEKGYRIILITSRKESERERTVIQLAKHNIEYDSLIMGLNRGERILINDKNSKDQRTARAFNIKRNEGLNNIKL